MILSKILNKNYLQFEAIEKHLGNKTLEFIVKHEFGHHFRI